MNKIFKLFALAMILCVGFFTGCEDINTSNKYESGEKTITISGEYVNEQSGYVAIYVDIPEGVTNIYVYRGDMLLGASHYIDYSIFEGQELAVGQHVIKDYYVNAGKSYNYTVSFANPNTIYKSQVLTVDVPEGIEKKDDFANTYVTDVNLTWDKEHHSFTWTFDEDKDEPNWINMPENMDNYENEWNDQIECTLSIFYGQKEYGAYPVEAWSKNGGIGAPEEIMRLNENTIGKTFSVSSIIIRYNGNVQSTPDNVPYCRYCYEKEIPVGSPIGSYPQSISFPSEQEYIAQLEGTWVAPDLETITFNADGSYSTQPSPFTDRTPLNSSGQAGVVYDGTSYELSINGYNLQWENDTIYTEDEVQYDILGLYDSSHSHIANLVKKQETDYYFSSFQVYDGFEWTTRICEIFFNENNECVVRDGSETSELYRGTYSVDGNTVTMKDSNNDVRFTAVVSENGIDHYCYKTDSGEYIIHYSSWSN